MKPVQIAVTFGKIDGSVWVEDNRVVKADTPFERYVGYRWSALLSILKRHGGTIQVAQ